MSAASSAPGSLLHPWRDEDCILLLCQVCDSVAPISSSSATTISEGSKPPLPRSRTPKRAVAQSAVQGIRIPLLGFHPILLEEAFQNMPARAEGTNNLLYE